ncbi:large subunit ribosomal protein L6 [Thermotomaculum hydrothermale]|uniref:Large ribosomal subunit protein uL6 n=1 Tax=Thermotomaculum hydrothermale TaxID=981385 RepID=A0A7R6PY29_9BACT|nr:50S ribosomal protein L6 [Thermotomaculum hydrothermale]BBB32915.1 large subunit ribosomal protein L6 [Thermotomaculum hydrothermale]
MSRIGVKPIPVPAGVQVTIKPNEVEVKGPKGVLKTPVPPKIEVTLEENTIYVKRQSEDKQTKSFHGLTRALLNNSVIGVTQGFKKQLQIIGTGYKAALKGRVLELNLGYSHPINFNIPDGIEISVDAKQNIITVEGYDKQKVGEVAAVIRRFREPDAYKGKGVRYVDEQIILKQGKTGK